MPSSLATPVLQVDTNVIHQVDTQNPDNLFSMWTGKLTTFAFMRTVTRTDWVSSLCQVRRICRPRPPTREPKLALVDERDDLL